MTLPTVPGPRRLTAHISDDTRLLLDLDTVAARLSVGRTLVAKYVYSGQLESCTVGRRRLVPADALVAFVDELRQDAGTLGGRP